MIFAANTRIWVAGHRGMVGSAIVRRLRAEGTGELILLDRHQLDLTRQEEVERFVRTERPEVVFLAAAHVGGILANSTRPADFIRDNLLIQTLVIDAAWRHSVKKLVFLGSSCIYPKQATQPIQESALLGGPLEPTNEAYAVAKIAGIAMAQAFRRQHGLDAISLMPCNLYGPGDSFDLHDSHVVPALIRKFHEARVAENAAVVVWGSGSPRREFLHVDDLADAAVFLAQRYSGEQIVNVGAGEDLTILDLAQRIAEIVGFRGEVVLDPSKPDGTPRKLLDVSKLSALGWTARTPLDQGLRQAYRWFVENIADAPGRC